MAWEWLEKLDEVTGEPGYSTATSQSWDNILSKVGTGWSPVSYVNGQCLEGNTSSNYYYDSAIEGLTKVITTTYGLTISYTGTPAPTSGFTFDTGVYQLSFGIGGLMNSATFRIAIDRDNELATIIVIREFQNGGYYTEVNDIIYYNRSTHYNKFYKWLIDHSPKKATVKVNYTLPSDQNYTYAKIVYKKDTRPDNEEDGTAVTILKDETFVNISKLDVGSNYWFTIFTDKNQSESFPYTVEELPYPPEYAEYLDYINGSGFFFRDYANASKDVGGVTYYTQKYYPNQNYSWFTSTDWSTIKLQVDNGNQVGPINCAEIYTVELTSSGDDRYNYSITPTYKPAPGFSSRYWLPNYWFASGNVGPMDGLYCIESANGAPTCEPTWEGNNTLYYIFTQILVKYCKNVNIKVDGVYWSKVK